MLLLLTLLGGALAQTTYKLEGRVTYLASANIEEWSGANTAITASEIRWDDESGDLSGKVCMETAGFGSGNFIRDGNGRDLLEVSKFPQACLTLSSLVWAENRKDALLEGMLDFRGRKKAIKVVGQLLAKSDGFDFKGSFKTSFSEWGMNPPRFLVLIGYDPLEVRLEAKATLKR
jgi:polyisoprenoid-binding protein YceI